MNTFEIALKSKNLPTTLEEILPLRAMGNVYLTFCKAKIKELEKLQANGKTDEKKLAMLAKQKAETLADAQDAGEILLDWEAEIGRISESVDIKQEKERLRDGTLKSKPVAKKKVELMGLGSQKELSSAQFIKNHPKEVEEVKKEARENNDIATKTAVINKVKFEREKERREQAEAKRTESKAIMSIEETQYINNLERIIALLPTEPPKNFSEAAFNQAKGYANIIINRLKHFTENKKIGE